MYFPDPKARSFELVLDTPNSKSNRKLGLFIEAKQEPRLELSLKAISPWKNIVLEGKRFFLIPKVELVFLIGKKVGNFTLNDFDYKIISTKKLFTWLQFVFSIHIFKNLNKC